MDILVLGIGNILLRDEGLGVRAVESLAARYDFPEGVELLDGGTAGFELLGLLGNRENVVLIDAIASGQTPGTVVRVEGEDVQAVFRTRISPHQLGISDVLAAATLTGELPRNLVLFGMEPRDLSTGLDLSPPVAANFERLLAAVVKELETLGCSLRARQQE